MQLTISDNYSLTINPAYSQQKLANHLPSSDSLAIAKIMASTQSPLLIIADDGYNAQRIYDELQFFASGSKVAIFANSEVLPYEKTTPQPNLTATRLTTLWQMLHQQIDAVIVSSNTLQQKICPAQYLATRVLLLKTGDKLSLSTLRQQLINNDYALVERVYQSGEFAIRGGTIDIMPMGAKDVVRIELFDDEIESLRFVDIATNNTLSSTNNIEIIPTREYPTDKESIARFSAKFAEIFNTPQYAEWVAEIKTQRLPAGSEFYLPLFFNQPLATLFDYLTTNWQIIYYSNTHEQLNANWQEIKRRYSVHNYQYPCLAPQELFLPTNIILETISHYKSFNLAQNGKFATGISTLPDLSVDNKNPQPFYKLLTFINKFNGTVYLVVDSLGRMEVLKNTLARFGVDIQDYKQLRVVTALVHNGFICNQVAFITEQELYEKQQQTALWQTKRQVHTKYVGFNQDNVIGDLAEIQIGDSVIHINHGIGRYCGITTQHIDGISYDMLELEYQNNAKLFIPVQNLHLISRYNALNQDSVTLTNLGSSTWHKTKLKVEKRIFDTASELLELYAKREIEQGFAFTLPAEYSDFAAQFGYEPTVDQQSCFTAIINDMQQKKPMDRLICGDVGFGKTEVAMRAAFICAMNGKQVAILTPTTLLTEQHYENFVQRFSAFPLTIAEISRFKSKKEINETLHLVKQGKVDILIGTHRLIQSDVAFHDLGLIIIDEEHRFGVKQKERLKQLRSNVDTLSMTATPIPRSLSMALDGIREFSIIATPPQKRLAVNTIVCHDDNRQLIAEAILREIRRGGQMFFLYNDVQSIHQMYDKLRALEPKLNIAIAHGQMKESELEHTIRDFVRQKYNLLLCSTIIETGIDIANANTIFIYRADKLGLAQLHQLRGRVGRSHHQAYCYLIVPENTSKDAQKRLEAISLTRELGAGFNLAMHDLEIRGAGEILGDKQSGDIKEVGLSLYTDMLKKAVRKLKHSTSNKLELTDEVNCDVDLHTSTIIPTNYCPQVDERLSYYRSLAEATTTTDIDLIYQDLINRYGITPPEVNTLLQTHYLRIAAISLGIVGLSVREKSVTIHFSSTPKISNEQLINTMQQLKTCKMTQSHQLTWYTSCATTQEKIKQANYVLELLREVR